MQQQQRQLQQQQLQQRKAAAEKAAANKAAAEKAAAEKAAADKAEAEKAEAEKAAAEKAAADKAKDQDQGCFRSVDSVPEGVRHVGTIGIQLGVRGATPLMNFRGEWGLGGRRGLPQQGMQEGVWGRRAHPVKYLMSILVRLGICLGLIGFA